MSIDKLGPFFKDMAVDVPLNSFIGYWCCKIFKTWSLRTGALPKDIAIILAISSAFQVATAHLLDSTLVKNTGITVNMVRFTRLLMELPTLSISMYLASKFFQAKPGTNIITLFGYITMCWKVNVMVKILVSSLAKGAPLKPN